MHTQRVGALSSPAARRERGAAILSALLVVALAALLVSGILWRQQVQVRRIENQRLIEQAQWVARGGLDWTRLVLRSEGDSAPGITWLGGLWAVPIARTRLSDLLGQIGDERAQEGEATSLTGSVEDAESRFNLRNLVSSRTPGSLQVNTLQVAAFSRLLELLGYDGSLAQKTANWMRAGLAYSAMRFQTAAPGTTASLTAAATPLAGGTSMGGTTGGTTFTNNPGLEDGDNDSANAPLIATDVDALLDVPGFTPEIVARLRPFVTVLPTVTPVNLNTASAEVIAATVPGLQLANAQAFVARRQTVFFHNLGDAQLALTGAGAPAVATLDSTLFDVNTSYFFVHGRVQHERAEVDRTTLVFRDPLTHTTRVVRVKDSL